MVEHPPQPEPIRVEIEPTNICNADCSFCPRWNMSRPYGYMDIDELEKFLDNLNSYANGMWLNNQGSKRRYPRLVFAGIGEPTLHPKIVEMVHAGKSRNFETELVTNGSRLTPEMTYDIVDAGLTRLSVSLHSLDPQIYKQIMGMNLDTTLNRITSSLKILENTNVDVEVWRVSTPESEGAIEKSKDNQLYQEFISKYNKKARILGPTMAWNRGGQLPNYNHWPKVHDSDDVWCEMLYHTLNISWDGTGVLCCCDYSGITVPLGNAWKDSIENLQKRREEIFKKQVKEPLCNGCRRPVDRTYENEVYPNLINISSAKRYDKHGP